MWIYNSFHRLRYKKFLLLKDINLIYKIYKVVDSSIFLDKNLQEKCACNLFQKYKHLTIHLVSDFEIHVFENHTWPCSYLNLSNSSSTSTLALSPRFEIVFISLAATVQIFFASSKAGIIMPPWNSRHARPRILGKDTNLVSVSCNFFLQNMYM